MARKSELVPFSAERLRELLEDQGMSIADLARQIDYSREHLSRALSSKKISVFILERIAEEFDCSAFYLRGLTPYDSDYLTYLNLKDDTDAYWNELMSQMHPREFANYLSRLSIINPEDTNQKLIVLFMGRERFLSENDYEVIGDIAVSIPNTIANDLLRVVYDTICQYFLTNGAFKKARENSND